MTFIRSLISEHPGSVKALTGIGLAQIAQFISPTLSAIVLGLTAVNLVLEIRKKLRK
jgi:hypothetical protein